MDTASSRRVRFIGRILGLALAAISLSGCIVVPAYHYRPYYPGYYYR